MAGSGGNKQQRRGRIDEAAIRVYLAQIGRGVHEAEAARAAGFSRSAFFRLRKRDADFALLWDAAIERGAGPRFVSPGKGRPLQIRRNRRVIFTDKRKEIFNDRFAGTCNLTEAAEAALVDETTVFDHLRKDPGFAARFREALALGHARLEADLLQRRIAGQQRLKAIEPTGEPEPEFDRALKLLQRWDRRDGSLGPRFVGHGQMKRWTFDEAIKLLAAKLKALDYKPAPPPEGDRDWDGDGGGGGEGNGAA